MKKSVCFTIFTVFLLLLFASAAMSIEAGMTKSMTGKVVGVDPGGKGIAISSGSGANAIVAGAIVTDGTAVLVKGKKASLGDIKEGDTVRLTYTYEKNDLYATKIVKR